MNNEENILIWIFICQKYAIETTEPVISENREKEKRESLLVLTLGTQQLTLLITPFFKTCSIIFFCIIFYEETHGLC